MIDRVLMWIDDYPVWALTLGVLLLAPLIFPYLIFCMWVARLTASALGVDICDGECGEGR